MILGYLDPNRHNDDQDDQDWLMSHADLMTLLLGFFIILYSISYIDQGKLKEVTESFTTAFENPKKSESIPASIQERSEQSLNAVFDIMNIEGDYQRKLEELERKLSAYDSTKESKAMLKAELKGEAEVVEDDQEIRIILPDEILFKEGTTKLSRKGRLKVAKVVTSLKPYVVRGVTLEITGHSSKIKRNKSVDMFLDSSLRASEVAKIAIRQGLSAEKLRLSGVGDTDPAISEKGLRRKALRIAQNANRRVELRVRFSK